MVRKNSIPLQPCLKIDIIRWAIQQFEGFPRLGESCVFPTGRKTVHGAAILPILSTVPCVLVNIFNGQWFLESRFDVYRSNLMDLNVGLRVLILS